MRAWTVVVFAVFAVGCDDAPPTDVEVDAATTPPTDAALTPVPAFPTTLTVAATAGSISNAFGVSSNGTAAAPLGQISITGGAGTFQHGESTSAFVYMTVPFGDYTLYQGFGVSATRWDVFWLYCQPAGLSYVYAEGISGPPLFYVSASGTCAGTTTETTAQVTLPAFQLPAPSPLGGYDVHGANIVVRTDGRGSLTLSGRTLPLLVFEDVDCSACGGPGWFELHSVLWDDTTGHAIFAIIYLMDQGEVLLTYARSLPDLGDPIGTATFPATWTRHGQRRAAVHHGFGVPPPGLR